ncbi:MAG: aminotransferase class I/II-fold pyridoxal phosphate-dependent enzyme [Xanthobacteraceae bacterium]
MTGRTADDVISPRIQRLTAGSPPAPRPELGPDKPVRRLHLNECPFPPSPKVVAAMREAAAALNSYPDHEGTALVRALAGRIGVTPERIVIGAGSNELLYTSADVALDPGDEAIAPVPGFVTYPKVIALRGGIYVGVPVRDDGIVDVDAMLAAVTPATRLVFVATPNNPTGGFMSAEELDRLATSLPDNLLLHVDEAYYEFSRHAGGPDVLAILSRRRGPWIVTRSFSKAYGLAGARVGYGITSTPVLAEAYRKARTTFSVGAVALAGATAALAEPEYVKTLLDHTAAERERMLRALVPTGFQALPSAANFVMFLTPAPAADLAAVLREENIHVLRVSWRDSPGALRISIGTREDTDAVIAALAASLTGA